MAETKKALKADTMWNRRPMKKPVLTPWNTSNEKLYQIISRRLVFLAGIWLNFVLFIGNLNPQNANFAALFLTGNIYRKITSVHLKNYTIATWKHKAIVSSVFDNVNLFVSFFLIT